MRFGIGQPVRRKEDERFLTGRGSYTDDVNLPNQAHACVVYSSRPHADIVSIDAKEARAAPGILTVLTGDDYAADGLGGIPPGFMPEDMGGPKGYRTARSALAVGRVRHVGERVALVVADTPARARDAADKVRVDYRELPLVVDAKEAVADGAPLLYEGAENNISFTLRMGDAEKTALAFESAAHVSRVSIYNNRLTACAMEPRSSIGDYNPADDRTVLYSSTQNPHGMRTTIAQNILGVPEANVRVVALDVGGGFGMKTTLYPEDVLVVWAARRLGRPVKWTASRSESFLGDDQGRDQHVEAELALDGDGRILALRWRSLHNVGAYIVGAGCVPVVFSLSLAPSVYDIPAIDVQNSAVLTNTPPTTPYRGAGRPEAIYIIERLIDQAARETGIDGLELRRRNFIGPEKMPYETHTHFIYDSGEFETIMEKCIVLADWHGLDGRRKASEARGRLRGRGLVYYIDDTGIFNEQMEIRFDPGGSLTIVAGTHSHGQGHETIYAQMVADWLGLPFEAIGFSQGDTAQVHIGRGTYASRSMTVGGSALRLAADDVIDKGAKLAAHLLEAAEDDVEFKDGAFHVSGTDMSMTIADVAVASFRPMGVPIDYGIGLAGKGAFGVTQSSFPNGCHICEVEIDRETGEVRLDRYAAVDDVGIVINPLLVDGQVQGGIAQGVGQALMENIHYDRGSGQLLSGSFMDYAMPRADTFPPMRIGLHEVPCKTNPIGVKGAGEGGTVAATPAVINAVLDALHSVGVQDIGLPASPERIWRAIDEAG